MTADAKVEKVGLDGKPMADKPAEAAGAPSAAPAPETKKDDSKK
ncbi:hypothetical protein [Candidatus Paracaedibacter symbiosus]|nr:hypothetical protein [Candidatus Paracaedibacter symbiosus]